MLGKLLRLVATKEGEAAQVAFVASYEFPKQGNKDFEARRLFSEDELDLFAEVIKTATQSGFAFDVALVRAMMRAFVVDEELVDPKTGELYIVSRGFVTSWVQSRGDLSKYKSSAIDPARANKANESTRDTWFSSLDTWARRMYERGQDPDDTAVPLWPWKCYRDIPPCHLYNMDEESVESSKARARVLAAADEPFDGGRRIFETGTVDGHMPWHLSDCLTTVATGEPRAPFYVHSRSGSALG
jgi:hypothetical protein